MADKAKFSERRALKVPSLSGVSTVELIVGKERAHFVVHKDLLCDAADFFVKAFGSNFKEGEGRSVDLPDDSAQTVNAFVQWVYFKTYIMPAGKDEAFDMLARLYVFADKVFASELKDDIMRWLFHFHIQRWSPPAHVVIYVFHNVLASSALRKLIVDWHVWHFDLAWFETEVAASLFELAPDFASSLVIRMAQKAQNKAFSPFGKDVELFLRSFKTV